MAHNAWILSTLFGFPVADPKPDRKKDMIINYMHLYLYASNSQHKNPYIPFYFDTRQSSTRYAINVTS